MPSTMCKGVGDVCTNRESIHCVICTTGRRGQRRTAGQQMHGQDVWRPASAHVWRKDEDGTDEGSKRAGQQLSRHGCHRRGTQTSGRCQHRRCGPAAGVACVRLHLGPLVGRLIGWHHPLSLSHSPGAAGRAHRGREASTGAFASRAREDIRVTALNSPYCGPPQSHQSYGSAAQSN